MSEETMIGKKDIKYFCNYCKRWGLGLGITPAVCFGCGSKDIVVSALIETTYKPPRNYTCPVCREIMEIPYKNTMKRNESFVIKAEKYGINKCIKEVRNLITTAQTAETDMDIKEKIIECCHCCESEDLLGVVYTDYEVWRKSDGRVTKDLEIVELCLICDASCLAHRSIGFPSNSNKYIELIADISRMLRRALKNNSNL